MYWDYNILNLEVYFLKKNLMPMNDYNRKHLLNKGMILQFLWSLF